MHHPFKKNTLSLLSRKKMVRFFVLYVFTFCALFIYFLCMSSFCGFIVKKKKILFVHLVLSVSQGFVRLGFIFLFLCMLLWFYIFHGLEYNIFTFSVA